MTGCQQADISVFLIKMFMKIQEKGRVPFCDYPDDTLPSDYSSTLSNWSFPTPHSGQTQVSASASNSTPGGIPDVGSPASGLEM